MNLKTQEINSKNSQKQDATGHFFVDFLRFEIHFSCSVWVLRRDSISAHVWYGLRTNLIYLVVCEML